MTYYRDDHGDKMRANAFMQKFKESYFRFAFMHCSAPITENAMGWFLGEATPYEISTGDGTRTRIFNAENVAT